MKGLCCLNCGKEVPPEDGHIFAEVFCCPDCFRLAEHITRRGQEELKQLLVLHQDNVRIALTRGMLHLGLQQVEEMDKKTLLEAVLTLQQKRDTQAGKAVVLPRSHNILPGSSKYAPKKAT